MLIKYQAMLIAAVVLIVHFSIYWRTEDFKQSFKWSLITLVAMVALDLTIPPLLQGGQNYLLEIIKGN